MPQYNVRTIEQVFRALGDGDQKAGRAVLIRITGKLTQHITNWISEGNLPRWTYLVVSQELKKRGYELDPRVCKVMPIPRPRKAKRHQKPLQGQRPSRRKKPAATSEQSAIGQRPQASTPSQ